jgi:hypothetical protein
MKLVPLLDEGARRLALILPRPRSRGSERFEIENFAQHRAVSISPLIASGCRLCSASVPAPIGTITFMNYLKLGGIPRP